MLKWVGLNRQKCLVKKTLKILVIDDNLLFLEVLVELLEMSGFQSIGAPTGALGLRLAENHKPDVIVCDINMPELNGFGVLKKLRENPTTANIPFIFITAQPVDKAYSLVQEMGAKGYLTKPFLPQELIEIIETITPPIR
ncbi:MAG TPA: response regulator [Waterburya sp.]|jgi:CheY-like chemotaxis protein